MQECAIRYERKGTSFIVGKVFDNGHGTIFFFTARARDLLRTYDAFSIPPEVINTLDKEGVKEIHVLFRPDGRLYVTDTESVRRNGIFESMHPQIGPRWHIPREYFSKRWLTYTPPFLEEEIVVTATSTSCSLKASPGMVEVGEGTSVTQLRFDWIESSGNVGLNQLAIEAAHKLGETIG